MEYHIHWHSVPVSQGLQDLGTRLGQNLLEQEVRSGVDIRTFRFPKLIEGRPVLIGRFTIKGPKLKRVEGTADEAENEGILPAHALKVEAILRIVDATLEVANLEAKETTQQEPSRRRSAGRPPATLRRAPGGLHHQPAYGG